MTHKHGDHGCCHSEDSCHEGERHHHHDEVCSEHEEFACQLLDLADEAWMEVLKEKIKENIKASNKGHLDELAKLVSESNGLRWKHKMEEDRVCGEYQEKLAQLFHKQ